MLVLDFLKVKILEISSFRWGSYNVQETQTFGEKLLFKVTSYFLPW